MDSQLILFNYDDLDTETKIVVQQRTGEIKDLVRTTAENIARIGSKLAEVRNRLNNGGRFDAWLESEFSWSRRTAYNFIAVHEQFGGDANFAQLDIATSALYLLAAPSTPSTARAEAIERAQAGERITHSAAKEIVQGHQPPPPPRLPDPPPPARDDVPAPAPYAPQHSTAATFEQAAPAPPRPAPPPPAPAPAAPPPPPPPAISGELLYINLTVRDSGALLSARQGDAPLAMRNVPLADVGAAVQALIEQVYGGGADDDEEMPQWLR